MAGWDTLKELYDQLQTYLVDDTLYLQGLLEKGQGSGTNVGYILDKGDKYISLFTGFTNVYNQCDVEYYVMAVSKAVQNVPGAVNQIINTIWRTTDNTLYENLSTALTNEDTETTAQLLATFTKDFLMAEIPDKAESSFYVPAGTMQD